jgi:hypothetical protein
MHTRRHQDFLETEAKHMLQMVAAGQATCLGQENRFIEGQAVMFKRWVAEFPDFGEVIYWEGTPLSR